MQAEATTAPASTRTMAAGIAVPGKLIFAPGGSATNPSASQFIKGRFDESQLERDPFSQFHAWFTHAQQGDSSSTSTSSSSFDGQRGSGTVYQPETATLSTASLPSGRVSGRMVYLKELDGRGFVVYSNWGSSRKAADLASNPHAALTFWWREVERQVRVEGTVERLSARESQPYFDTRIRGSRIGAWASQQSAVLKDRAELEDRVAEVERRFNGVDAIPVPDFWGGLRIVPDMVEFWQGRENRLHDRFRFLRDEEAEGGWRRERLSP